MFEREARPSVAAVVDSHVRVAVRMQAVPMLASRGAGVLVVCSEYRHTLRSPCCLSRQPCGVSTPTSFVTVSTHQLPDSSGVCAIVRFMMVWELMQDTNLSRQDWPPYSGVQI